MEAITFRSHFRRSRLQSESPVRIFEGPICNLEGPVHILKGPIRILAGPICIPEGQCRILLADAVKYVESVKIFVIQ